MIEAQWEQTLLSDEPLSHEESTSLAQAIFSGDMPVGKLGAVLCLLNQGKITGVTLAAFAMELRSRANLVLAPLGSVDTCGTGGGSPSFNISTAASIVVAAAEVPVAKHGNRAVTSTCGSADVLESLGIHLPSGAQTAGQMLRDTGFTFMLAPNFHPAMKVVGPVRRQLWFRTIFNLLGPLANPAGVRRQVIGVFDSKYALAVTEALARLGVDRALVVHGRGMDEFNPVESNSVFRVEPELLEYSEWHPELGLSAEAILPGNSIAENAALLVKSVTDVDSSRAKAILPSAAAGLFVAGQVATLDDGLGVAAELISSGKAGRKLEQIRAWRPTL